MGYCLQFLRRLIGLGAAAGGGLAEGGLANCGEPAGGPLRVAGGAQGGGQEAAG